MRPAKHADDQSAAGIVTFSQVGGGIPDLGDSAGVGDPELVHHLIDHIGMRTAAGNFIAADGRVDQAAVRPTQTIEDDARDRAVEPRVESDADPRFVESLEDAGRAWDLVDRGVGAVKVYGPRYEITVDVVEAIPQ